jgi:hypothetical protein
MISFNNNKINRMTGFPKMNTLQVVLILGSLFFLISACGIIPGSLAGASGILGETPGVLPDDN